MIEALALYAPILVSIVLFLSLRIYPRLRVAIILNTFWVLASLPWVNLLCESLGFWSFEGSRPFFGMPLSIFIGWVISWGVVVTVLLGKLPTPHARFWLLGGVLLFDLLAMPLLGPNIQLSAHWWIGELIVIALCLAPMLWLGHWTLSWTRVCWRAFLLSIAFGSVTLTLTPYFAGDSLPGNLVGYSSAPPFELLLNLTLLFFASVPAVAGVVAFAKLGKGTPIPFDPPRKLVMTGVYSYLANPIQLGIVASLWLMATFTEIDVYYMLVGVAIVYCVGIARWSETGDMEQRFGSEWLDYKKRVRNWLPRILPAEQPPASIYIALDCGPCTQLAKWIIKKKPLWLEVRDASEWSGEEPLESITYQYASGEVEQGVGAVTALLQHLHLGWAFVGWTIAYPGVKQFIQLAMDASGGSKRSCAIGIDDVQPVSAPKEISPAERR